MKSLTIFQLAIVLIILFLNSNSIYARYRRNLFGNLPVKGSKYPYTSQVLLQILSQDDSDPPNQEHGTCTGTIVAPRVVLTAGHCFDDRVINGIYYRVHDMWVRYGGFIRSDDLALNEALGWVQHPNYKRRVGIDLGIVVTRDPVNIPCNQIAVPDRWDLTKNVLKNDRDTFMCGWGTDQFDSDDNLRCIEYKSVHLECNLRWNSTWCFEVTPIRFFNNTIGWQTSCFGDSGAGIFWKVVCQPDSEYQLVAVLSGVETGELGCGTNKSDIATYLYSDHVHINEWIVEQINEHGGTQCPPG